MKRFPLCLLLAFLWILGSYKGRVALWKDGKPDPVQVFPYRVENFPPRDRKALEEGIRINTDRELIQLLEDYLS